MRVAQWHPVHRCLSYTMSALAALVLLAPAAQAQAQARSLWEDPEGPLQIGGYGGFMSEVTRFAGRTAHAREAESFRFGALIGRWSVGYSEVTIKNGGGTLTTAGTAGTPRLRLQGAEFGRLLVEAGPVQIGAHLTLSSATIARDWFATGSSGSVVDDRRVLVVAPAASLALPVNGWGRLEVRVGGRIGQKVTFNDPSASIDASGVFATATYSLGWFGAWRHGQ